MDTREIVPNRTRVCSFSVSGVDINAQGIGSRPFLRESRELHGEGKATSGSILSRDAVALGVIVAVLAEGVQELSLQAGDSRLVILPVYTENGNLVVGVLLRRNSPINCIPKILCEIFQVFRLLASFVSV